MLIVASNADTSVNVKRVRLLSTVPGVVFLKFTKGNAEATDCAVERLIVEPYKTLRKTAGN